MAKISIIGAGNVGSTAGFCIAQKKLGDVVLVDIVESVKGKALDILEAMPYFGSDSKITGTTDYKEIENSDIVVVTAGLPRRPGMTREDLLEKNTQIVRSVCENIKKYAPNAIVIVVTNPLDLMCYVALKTTGFDKKKVIGMAGALDSARFKAFIAEKVQVSISDVDTIVVGSHGSSMVPVIEHTTIKGKPITGLIKQESIKELVERTRNGGMEIVNYLGTGSAYYAPATSVTQMAEAIIKDSKKIMPASVYVEGEYGYEDIFLGVPVILGKNGAEKIVELKLSKETKQLLDRSADAIKENIKKHTFK